MIFHPATSDISLSEVLGVLGDEKRLAIVGCLARFEADGGLVCKQLSGVASKTNLSYHMAKLREAGLIAIRPEGTRRYISLRRTDLNLLFPGLLDAVLAGAAALPLVEMTLKELEANGSRPASQVVLEPDDEA